MPPVRSSETQREIGRRRLAAYLPGALKEFEAARSLQPKKSALGGAVAPYLTVDNFDSLVIHPAAKGGWEVSLELKRVPQGIPNCIGTPVERPHRTEEEAEKAAQGILLLALLMGAHAKTPEAAGPVFLLYGYTVRLDQLSYEIEVEHDVDLTDQGAAAHAIATFIDKHCPDGFTPQVAYRWPRIIQAELLATLHIATLAGIFAYPLRKPEAPK